MDIAGVTIRCNGINHKDTGKITKCKGCGTHLARRDDGKLFGVRRYTTEYGNERFVYSCYAPTHKCDPERAKRYHEAAQRDIDAGEMVRGQSVIVARGRKIPKGITGTITWVGESDWGPRARVQPQSGDAFFIPTKNLDVTKRVTSE